MQDVNWNESCSQESIGPEESITITSCPWEDIRDKFVIVKLGGTIFARKNRNVMFANWTIKIIITFDVGEGIVTQQ